MVCFATQAPANAPLPPFMQLKAGEPHFIRVHFYHNESSADASTMQLDWKLAGSSDGAVPVPSSALSAHVPAAQLSRLALQTKIATGWGTWWRPNVLAVTLLPEAATLTLGLCQLSSGDCMDPLALFVTEQEAPHKGPEQPKTAYGSVSRPGLHAWDRSYW